MIEQQKTIKVLVGININFADMENELNEYQRKLVGDIIEINTVLRNITNHYEKIIEGKVLKELNKLNIDGIIFESRV